MAGHQWRGYDIHGFDGPAALAYSMDNAGHRHAHNFEVCAKLMNGDLYAVGNLAADDADRREYENLIVSDEGLALMALQNGVNNFGWRGYKPDVNRRTLEKPSTDFKIRHNINLPVREINGGVQFRRHVFLPPALLEPGGVVYNFLEYKSLPNIEYRARASILAAREAHEADGGGGHNGVDGGAVDNGAAGEGAGHEGAVIDGGLWEDELQNYKSSSDEDYEPDSDEEEDSS